MQLVSWRMHRRRHVQGRKEANHLSNGLTAAEQRTSVPQQSSMRVSEQGPLARGLPPFRHRNTQLRRPGLSRLLRLATIGYSALPQANKETIK